MIRIYRRWLVIASASLFFGVMSSAIGSTQKFISSNTIHNQVQNLQQLKKQSVLPVIFPLRIPVSVKDQQYYASFTSYGINSDYDKFWQINVDATPNCHGVKVCNIGFVSAEKNGQLTHHYQTLPDNQVHLKERVQLKNNITGYYTPFHIQAGGVNPTLEWKIGEVLYTLSWKINAPPAQQKQILTKMASNLRSQAKPGQQ